jgi:hypothetical protein
MTYFTVGAVNRPGNERPAVRLPRILFARFRHPVVMFSFIH